MFSFLQINNNDVLFSNLRLAKIILKPTALSLATTQKITFVSRTLIQKIKLVHYTRLLPPWVIFLIKSYLLLPALTRR